MKESHFEYATGRYDCVQCGEGVLITQVTDTLPVCPRCGGQHYEGQPPKIIAPKPSLPKKYAAGMYECKGCGDKLLMTEPDESLPECAYCGANKLVAVTKT